MLFPRAKRYCFAVPTRLGLKPLTASGTVGLMFFDTASYILSTNSTLSPISLLTQYRSRPPAGVRLAQARPRE
jgi:hypothetical protein